jgi:predicted ATP-binding protein involved in virulence
MILDKISLANFRGFEQLDLTFDPKVTVIAGVNGVGKSGILHALTVLFSRSLPDFTPSTAKPISLTEDDIYHGKPALESSAIFSVADQRCHIAIQRIRDDAAGDKALLLLENVRTAFVRTGNLEAARTETYRALQALKDRPAQPVVIFFSPRRQLPGKPKTLPKPKPFDPKEAYQFALDDRDVTLREFMHWFRAQEVSTHPQAPLVLARLREVVTTFLPEFTNLRIETAPLRFFVDKGGIPLMLNQLSDGERGMLAILFDITRRLAIANPESSDPVAEGAAIVLIDEIELHLHPIWQRQVLKRFTETFSCCQFVATSHSPQVLGEVEARCVRLLQGCRHVEIPAQSYGMDTNWILQVLLGADEQDHAVKDEVTAISALIANRKLEEAQAKVLALRERIGNSESLQRAASTIERIRMINR